MPEVLKSSFAQSDLFKIWFRIAEDSPQNAHRFLTKLDQKFVSLAHTPEMGPARPQLGAGVRLFPVADYNILYRPRQNGVEILRVLHAAQEDDDLVP